MTVEAETIAAACSKLALFERVALERVLARGGRARLDEVGLDPAIIARLERVLGWFGFERGSPRAGAAARVAISEDARDLVASSLAGVPSLRGRPISRLSVPALDAEAYRARARAQGSEALLHELAARGGIALLAALPRDLRAAALERGSLVGLGDVGRLDLREKGIDLEGPAAVLAPEVLTALAGPLPGPGGPGAQTRLAGALLAVEPALALARESELVETKQGVLAARSRERLEKAYPRARLELTPEKDELDQLVRALVDAKLLERTASGLLPGSGVAAYRALAPREQVTALLRALGARSLLCDLATSELLALDAPVPADLPLRLAVLRLVDAPAPPPSRAVPLEDALGQGYTGLLPAAEMLGLVTFDRSTTRIAPTALVTSLRPGEGVPHPLVLSADGEALVVPGPRAVEGAILLGRIGELVSASDILRYRVTSATAAAAQASGDDLDASLARVRVLVRGDVPAGFERVIREAAAGSVRARTRVIHVLEIPRVLAADRAARVLGPLVLDRITPTLLALTGPITPAARRALAKEGVFIDEP